MCLHVVSAVVSAVHVVGVRVNMHSCIALKWWGVLGMAPVSMLMLIAFCIVYRFFPSLSAAVASSMTTHVLLMVFDTMPMV